MARMASRAKGRRHQRRTPQPTPTLTAEQAAALGYIARARRDATTDAAVIDANSNPAGLYDIHRQIHQLDQQAAKVRNQVASPALRVQLG